MAFESRAIRARPLGNLALLALLLASVPSAGRQGAPVPQNPQVPQAQQAAPVPAAPVPAPAAVPPGVDPAPWLYKGSDIPQDKAWSFGRLPNGLRYAVRRNGVPPGQVAVRVRIDAGSLYEEDSEQGFAHFLEHLSFRASRYVPDGEAKRVWQRLGATFGSDSNASTTPTQTLYKLDLPGATPQGLDESLKIMAGMMAGPVIDDKTVAAERPVVLAEQREQPGPQVRMGDIIRQTFFAGQPLADRSPIGTIKTLEAATGASVKAFHDRWYRPERAVVIVSGDMDPSVFAAAIAKHFSAWRGIGPNPADPDFGKPDPSKPATGTIAEAGVPAIVTTATMRPWQYQDDTILFNQRRMVDMLAARLISRRLETRARGGGSFLQAGVGLDDVSRSANLTSVNIVPVGDNWAAALKDVRAVIADAQVNPPTQAEVDREYADYDTALRTQVETSRVEAGARQADDMASALDIRETVTSPEVSYQILRDARAKGMFTPASLQASAKKIFEGVDRAVVNTRTPDANAATELAAALKADVTGLAGKRRAQNAVTFNQLPALGRPATVAKREKIAGLDLETVTFSNGARLLLFPNGGETGRVYVRVRFGGGYNQLPADRPSAAWAGDLALWASGVGKLDQGDLDQLVAGRRIGMDFDVGDDAFQFGALTSPADLEDQLRLIAAKMSSPRWDAAPVARARAVATAAMPGYSQSPDGVLSRDLERLLRDGDPRWGVPDAATVQGTTERDFRRLWQPLLASGPVEVSVFGDVKAEDAVAAVGKTIGALKARPAALPAAPPVRFPAHVASPVIRRHDGPANQAAAVIAWPTGGGVAGIGDSRRLDVLAQVFSDRLFERLRQAAGASYSPNVASQWPIGLASGGRMVAIGQVQPEKVGFFFQLSREIAADLVARPIATEELERIMRPMAQYILRASSGNQFWLNQLGGAAFDPRRAQATATIAQDFVSITPAQLQQVAAKYLRPERDWTMAVLPKDAGAPTPTPTPAPTTPAAPAGPPAR